MTVVNNTDTASLYSLTVVDTLSSGLVNVTTAQPAGYAAPTVIQTGTGSMYVWSAPVGPWGSASYTFTITGYMGEVCAVKQISNTAYAFGVGSGGPASGQSNSVSDFVAPYTFNYSAVKEQAPVSPMIGNPITYRNVIANTGSATISSLTVIDTISPVITGVTTEQPVGFGAPTITSVAGGTRFTWTGSTPLFPGSAYTFTLTGMIDQAPPCGSLSNTAYVSAVSACGTGSTLTNVVEVVYGLTHTSVFESMQAIQASGDPVAYRIVVTNTGITKATSVMAITTMPPVISVTGTDQPAGFSGPSTAQVSGGTRYVWSATGVNLDPGASMTFTMTGVAGWVCSAADYTTTAFASLTGPCGNRSTSPEVGTSLADQVTPFYTPGVTVTHWQGMSAPETGANVSYVIVVQNSGTSTLSALTLTDTVPSCVTGVNTFYESAPAFSAPVVTSVTGGTRYVWYYGGTGITPGQCYTFTIMGKIGEVCVSTSAPNVATAAGYDTCAWTGWVNSGQTSFTVAPYTFNYTAVKEQTPASPDSGDPVVYRVIITNTGGATITSLNVTDTISPMITGATSAFPAGFAPPTVTQVAGGTQYAWTKSGLSMYPGTSYTFTVFGLVGVACLGTSVGNTAYVNAWSSCGVGSNQYTNAVGFRTTGLYYAATITEQMIPAAPLAGDTVTYRIVVTNIGEATIAGMTVSDTVSPVITGAVSAYPSGGFTQTITNVAGGTRWVWTAVTLAMVTGQSYTFTITGKVGAVCSGVDVSNTVTMNSIDSYCNSWFSDYALPVAFHAGPPSPVVSTKVEWVNQATGTQTPAPVVNDTIRFSITVGNDGVATVFNVTVCDTLPSDTTGIEAISAPAGWVVDTTRSGTGGKLLAIFTKSAMIPGESVVLQVDAIPRAAGDVVNSAFTTFQDPCGSSGSTTPYSVTNRVTAAAVNASAAVARMARVKQGGLLVGPNVIAPGGSGMVNLTMLGSAGGVVEVSIYDQGDRLVKRFSVTLNAAGLADQPYDGRDQNGARLAPGAYWIRASGGGVDDRKPFMVVPKRRR